MGQYNYLLMMSQKGISPLIASVLLIAFTVSVAMIVMGWFSSFVRTTTTNVSGVTETAIGCSSGIIEIDHIYIQNQTGSAWIVAKNSGQIALSVVGSIINTTGGICNSSTSGTNIPAGSVGTLTLAGCQGVNQSTKFSSAILTTNCAGITDSTTRLSDVTFNA